MSRLSRSLKKLTKKSTLLGKTVRSVLTPVTGGVRLVRAVVRGESVTDAVREAGREKFFGIRVREVGAAIGIAYGGAALYGATGASSGAAGGVSAAGGVAAGSTSAVAASTGFGATLAGVGKYSALALALSRQLGAKIGPGSPEYAPQTIPSENFLPGGNYGAIYPGEFGGPALSPSDGGAPGGFLDQIGLGGGTLPIVAAVVIVLAGVFIAVRR